MIVDFRKACAVHLCTSRGLSSGDCQEQLVFSFLGVLTDNLFGQEITAASALPTAAEEGKSPTPYLHCILQGCQTQLYRYLFWELKHLGLQVFANTAIKKKSGPLSPPSRMVFTMHRQSLLLINRSFTHLQSEEGTAALHYITVI